MLEQLYVNSLRPQLRRELRTSSVHSYGFKPGRRTSDITALLRQLLYLADVWNQPLILALQDVKFASNSMEHEHIATSMYEGGASAQLVAAHLRELTGIRAFITLPGIGDTKAFNYSKGGKQ